MPARASTHPRPRHTLRALGLAVALLDTAAVLPTGPAAAQPAPEGVAPATLTPIATLTSPIALATRTGSTHLFVAERGGLVRELAVTGDTATVTTLLDISGYVSLSEGGGLLGLAFDPTGERLYVHYTNAHADNRLVEYTMDGATVDLGTRRVVLAVRQPPSYHKGGDVAFGPDGRLYLALGDGDNVAIDDPNDDVPDVVNPAQDRTSLLGKILRINPRASATRPYRNPLGNPFVGQSPRRAEVWAYGLRNPWRMSFDRATGQLWCGDVGQNDVEEIDILVRGGNYGWRVYEGNRSNINPTNLPASSFVAPVYTYTHAEGASVTGGYVYRGSAVPALVGAYVHADFVSGRVWALVYDGQQAIERVQIATTSGPASFGEDAAGELHVCCFDGRIRRFAPDAGNQEVSALPATLSATGLFTDLATLAPVPGLLEYDVTAALWADGASKRRWFGLPGSSRIGFTTDAAWTFPIGTVLVKHFEIARPGGGVRRLETRVLLHQASGWTGFTYRWNETGSDADLVDDAGASTTIEVDDGSGAAEAQTWHFPGRAQCHGCHPASAGTVLGLRTAMTNRDFAFPLRVDNQLRTWNHLGLFTTDLGDPAQLPAFADPDDATAPLSARARAYLAANCANCHHPQGPTPVDLDLRGHVATAAMHLFGVAAATPVPGGAGQRAVAGDRLGSDLWLRVTRRDAYGMPPLGSTVVDEAGAALLGAWLDQPAAAAPAHLAPPAPPR